MLYIEAPQEYEGSKKSIFLAGSITGAADWQSVIIGLLKDEDLVILNPRRKVFHTSNSKYDEEQISWERKYMKKADAISFWFSKETLSPITLYELGEWTSTDKTIFIGIDKQYQRIEDIEIQTKLARSDVKIVHDINALAELIKNWNSLTN
ncbi:MAG: nucleoside 2-deoxyribosyltransferase domain-containing protein [Candidatus Micrarchaeaceae archaeon]